ncbi:FtsX-like permease family protein [Streptomyces sp. NRRL F-5123]|uniref:FtsX-like permease family protein n=1 Tax=Streptomyces sp. NRRL F-5123 TaxID=1463856 RepID=UPI0004E17E07|nr:FtsX-like permease family protein [Streptomyces sp. NRRL F-5123]
MAAPVRERAAGRRSGARGGGLAARMAVLRWSWRMLRREWRRQVLLLALLTLTVCAAVCGLAAVHAWVPTPAGTYGPASQRIVLTGGADGAGLPAAVRAARAGLAPVDVVAHRRVPVPGSVDTLDLRAEDPHGPFTAGRLRLVSGRYPAAPGEVALSAPAAGLLGARAGGAVTLGGQRFAVTGTVENPGLLGDTFSLAAPAPGATVAGRPAASADLLTNAPRAAVDTFRRAAGGTTAVLVERRGDLGRGAADTLVLVMATVGLLLVALVAAAAFAAVAQRRLRQIGMLGTLGATDRGLRLVLVGHGALTGLAAVGCGAVLGAAVWVPLAPALEHGADHRIDRLALPWPLLALLLAVSVAAPTAAAWWPARTVARVPITRALSARPPRPVPARQSVWAAAVLLAAGAAGLVASHRASGLLVAGGIVAVVAGLLLLSPPAVRLLAAPAGRMPFAARVALRDLGRHQARSGAALAAVTLALGIPVAVSVLAAVNQPTAATGNLPARQVLVRIGGRGTVVPVPSARALRVQQDVVERWAATVHGTAVPLEMAYDPAVPRSTGPDGAEGQPVVEAGSRRSANSWATHPLYVATPAAVREFGLAAAMAAAPDARMVSSLPGGGPLAVVGGTDRTAEDDPPRQATVRGSAYGSDPHAFLTPSAVADMHLRTVPVGWLVTARHDLTADDRAAARTMAAGEGLQVEVRDARDGLRTLRLASVAAGGALALAVLAMTVGTLRAEAADDLRTLTATGATSRTRRALTATTAGGLALAGTVLGALGAYLILLCAYGDDLGQLSHVPVAALLTAFPGIPLLAAAGGWLAAGREPAGIARRLLE